LFVKWSQHSGIKVRVQPVDLHTEINETSFDYMTTTEKDIVGKTSTAVEAYTNYPMEFDVTAAVYDIISSSVATVSNPTPTILQFRLFTKQYGWVKFASKQYFNVDDRPKLVVIESEYSKII